MDDLTDSTDALHSPSKKSKYGKSYFESFAKKLSNPSITREDTLKYVTEIRQFVEILHANQYTYFQKYFFPELKQLLETIPPSFVDNQDHKV